MPAPLMAAGRRAQPAAVHAPLPSSARWLGLFSGLFSGLLSLPEAPPASAGRLSGPAARQVKAAGARATHGACLPEGKSLRQPHPCVPSSSWWATAAERTSSWSRACPTCRAPRSPCKRRPSGSLVSHDPDPSVLSHVTAEPCRPKAGRALEGFPAALRQPCLCSGWRWEPFWVTRSLPGCCGRMAGAEGMVGGLCWEGGLASGICDGLCVPRARRAAPEKFA